VSISELLKIVRQYHLSLGGKDAGNQGDATMGLQGTVKDTDLESSLSEAEMSSARWAWDWLRSRPQILINGNKRWNRLELSEALALPEAGSADITNPPASGDTSEPSQEKGQKPKKTLTTRPRIHPSQDLVWQTLTRHGVDYKRVPALEWACLQGIASARAEGILQSDLRRLVNQDKRSLPKRTDSLARKGYVVKKTVVVQKMKTSRLWLIDFAPPDVETETCGLDLSPETLSKDLDPVQWHKRWTGSDIDMDALGRTAVGVVKAFNVMRYADLRSKMGVVGKRWQMKTLAKNCQRLVDMGVLKYTAASFPGSRKVFKDCLKFMREPSAEEWEKFLATGKKTSQYSDPTRHREPKPNALALYGKTGDDGQKGSDDRSKMKRIFSGWAPEKPLAQTVFEVIQSAGPEGASNPQVSVATVGYQHRRYLASYLTKVAETQQPQHLKQFQVISRLVRTGITSAYMFSARGAYRTKEEVIVE
jgi:transcription factor C subunit 3